MSVSNPVQKPKKLIKDLPVTASELAEMTGDSGLTVGKTLKALGIQRTASGKFILGTAVFAMFTNERNKVRESDDQDDSKGRILASRAKLEELKLARELGKTVTVEAILERTAPIFAALRSQLLTLPKKVAPILKDGMTAGEREQLLTKHIHDALRELVSLPEKLKDISPPEVDDPEGLESDD